MTNSGFGYFVLSNWKGEDFIIESMCIFVNNSLSSALIERSSVKSFVFVHPVLGSSERNFCRIEISMDGGHAFNTTFELLVSETGDCLQFDLKERKSKVLPLVSSFAKLALSERFFTSQGNCQILKRPNSFCSLYCVFYICSYFFA